MTTYHPPKAAAERSEAVETSRAARVPEVGIWWLINNRLVADSIPYTEAPEYAGFREGKNDHYPFFNTLQRIMSALQSADYTDFPRGRVLYDGNRKKFICYGSAAFVKSSTRRQMVLSKFKLPSANTLFVQDMHYEDPAADLFN